MKRSRKRKPQMGRPTKGDQARTTVFTIKLSQDDRTALDAKRGDTPLGSYMREKALAS